MSDLKTVSQDTPDKLTGRKMVEVFVEELSEVSNELQKLSSKQEVYIIGGLRNIGKVGWDGHGDVR